MASSEFVITRIADQLKRSHYLISELLCSPKYAPEQGMVLSRLQEAIWWLEEMPVSTSDDISLDEINPCLLE